MRLSMLDSLCLAALRSCGRPVTAAALDRCGPGLTAAALPARLLHLARAGVVTVTPGTPARYALATPKGQLTIPKTRRHP